MSVTRSVINHGMSVTRSVIHYSESVTMSVILGFSGLQIHIADFLIVSELIMVTGADTDTDLNIFELLSPIAKPITSRCFSRTRKST